MLDTAQNTAVKRINRKQLKQDGSKTYVDTDPSSISINTLKATKADQIAQSLELVDQVQSDTCTESEHSSSIWDNDSDSSEEASTVLASMSQQEALDTAVRAVRHATYRDGFSGGYINVLIVNASGIHHLRRVDCRQVPIGPL